MSDDQDAGTNDAATGDGGGGGGDEQGANQQQSSEDQANANSNAASDGQGGGGGASQGPSQQELEARIGEPITGNTVKGNLLPKVRASVELSSQIIEQLRAITDEDEKHAHPSNDLKSECSKLQSEVDAFVNAAQSELGQYRQYLGALTDAGKNEPGEANTLEHALEQAVQIGSQGSGEVASASGAPSTRTLHDHMETARQHLTGAETYISNT